MLGVGTQDIRDEDCSVLRRTGMSLLGRGSLRPALERDGPDDHLVVDGSQGSANEGADPEDPLQTTIGTRKWLDQLFGTLTKDTRTGMISYPIHSLD